MKPLFKINGSFLFVLSLAMLWSCEPDEPITPSDTFDKGVFVVNEGAFNGGTGTITYKDNVNSAPIQDVFGIRNSGSVLGNVAQSMIKFDNKYFIAVNNANKVIVTDDEFKLITIIKDVELPRYFATDGQKLFLSTWGADFRSGKILEINPFTYGINSSISVGNAPEQMLINNNKLYVTLGSPYGEDSDSLAVINIISNKVEEKIWVGDNPTSIVKDINNDIWVLCTGNYALNPNNNSPGSLVNINKPGTMSFPLSNGVSSLVINKTKDQLIFIQGDKVISHPINAGSMVFTSVFQGNAYKLGVSPDNILYIADPKDYKSAGTVFNFNLNGGPTTSFASGIAPTFFYFED